MYMAEVLADSISPDGVRLTTLQVRYPHAVHKDMLTHRVFERNFMSFRAYPIEKVVEMVRDNPFVPEEFSARERGMDVGEAIADQEEAVALWLDARDHAVNSALGLIGLGVNKGHVNVLLQDFAWITGIITATEWSNFWALRAFPPEGSKPRAEVQRIAGMMHEAMEASAPRRLDYGEPHLPMVRQYDRHDAADRASSATGTTDYGGLVRSAEDTLLRVSTGRVARVSYLTHDGVRDMDMDVGLHDRLLGNGHMSPFGHPAWPIPLTGPKYVEAPDPRVGRVPARGPDWRGPLWGWCSYRSSIPNEHDFALAANG